MARRIPYAARFNEDENPKFDPAQREIAWKAITAFRAMLPQLRTFARAISRNPKLDVEITTEKPYTKGDVIYIQPPLELGRDHTHDRPVCGRRAANGKQLCPACQVHEVITFFVFHEIGHVFFDSQKPVSSVQKSTLQDIASEWHPAEECGHLNEIMNSLYRIPNLTSMQLLGAFNQFLPMIFNCFEDTRVNEATFRARPGLRGVFDINIERLTEEGSENPDGDIRHWGDEPLDAQFMIGLFLISSGHFIEGRLDNAVVTALRTTEIQTLCERAADCNSAAEVFNLSIEAFRAAQHLGYCVVPKCEPVPQLPGLPDTEDQDDNSEEAGNDESSEDSEGSNSDSKNPPEDTDDTNKDDADSSSGDSDEEATNEAGDTSEDDGETGEPSDDEGEVDNDATTDGRDNSESTDNDAQGEGGGDSPEDDTESADSSADSPDGGDSGGGDDEGECSENSGSEQSELEEADDNGGGSPSQGRPGEPGKEEFQPGEQNGSELHDSVRDDNGSSDDRSGVDIQDDDGGAGDESSPVDEDASDTEEVFAEEECDHVGEYECTKCGADLTLLDDDPWATEPGADMTPVDGPSDPVDDMESSDPHHGTPDDAAAALGRFLMHPMNSDELAGLLDDMAGGKAEEIVGASEHEDMDPLLARLIKVAVTQSLFFEKDSGIVDGVEIASYPDDRILWDIRHMAREYGTSVSNIITSVIPSESLIGSATQKMRRLFQENQMTRRDRNLRSGRLDMRSLARRAPVQDDRLFGKKTKPRGKSYAVVIGVDCSGSTETSERNLKIKRAAMAQVEVLNRLGIPWAGYAHTAFRTPLGKDFSFTRFEGPYYVYLLPFKTMKEQWTDGGREKLSAIRPLAENLDGHTLEQYINEVIKVEADERILIYYTDGQMPAANYDEEREVLIEQCKRAKKLGIHLLGVGINTDSPSAYGMDTVEVNSDEDIHRVIEQLERRLSE